MLLHLTVKALDVKMVEFANSVFPNEAAQNHGSSHLDLLCHQYLNLK